MALGQVKRFEDGKIVEAADLIQSEGKRGKRLTVLAKSNQLSLETGIGWVQGDCDFFYTKVRKGTNEGRRSPTKNCLPDGRHSIHRPCPLSEILSAWEQGTFPKVGGRVTTTGLQLGCYLDFYVIDFHLVVGSRNLIPI